MAPLRNCLIKAGNLRSFDCVNILRTLRLSIMATLPGVSSLFRLDGKVALITGGRLQRPCLAVSLY
jgi:hypothetical protein